MVKEVTNLQVPTTEDTLVQDQRISHETRLGEFDVGVSDNQINTEISIVRITRKKYCAPCMTATHPLG